MSTAPLTTSAPNSPSLTPLRSSATTPITNTPSTLSTSDSLSSNSPRANQTHLSDLFGLHEPLLADFSCALLDKIRYVGRLYVFPAHVAFHRLYLATRNSCFRSSKCARSIAKNRCSSCPTPSNLSVVSPRCRWISAKRLSLRRFSIASSPSPRSSARGAPPPPAAPAAPSSPTPTPHADAYREVPRRQTMKPLLRQQQCWNRRHRCQSPLFQRRRLLSMIQRRDSAIRHCLTRRASVRADRRPCRRYCLR
jgi:hypothetical protein